MSSTVSNDERKTLINITRKLLRAKRQAFLRQVQEPQGNVDQFCYLLLQLATISGNSSVESINATSSSPLSSSSSTLGSISEDDEDFGQTPYPHTSRVEMSGINGKESVMPYLATSRC